MLSKDQRMNSREYRLTQKKGKYKHSDILQLCYLTKSTSQSNSFAVTVSKKVAKNAVERNYLRRKYYDFLQKNYPQFPGPYFFIISLRKKPENWFECEENLYNLLKSVSK